MKIPEWLNPGLSGAAIGAIALATVGFTWGGWETASSARQMASSQSESAVVAALVPICLDRSRDDAGRAETLAALRNEPGYKRRDVLMEAGWATVPGSDSPDRALANACLSALNL